MRKPPLLKKAIRIILILVPLAVLGNVTYTLMVSDTSALQALLTIPFKWFFAAILLSLGPWLLAALRLGLWSRFFQLDLSFRKLMEIVLANDVAAAATPTAIGGGYAKLGLLVYHGANPGLAASLMVIGSLEDYLAFLVIVPICWALAPPEHLEFGAILSRTTSAFSAIPSELLFAVLAFTAVFVILKRSKSYRRAVRQLFSRLRWAVALKSHLVTVYCEFIAAFRVVSCGGKLFFTTNVVLAGLQWVMRYSVFTALAYGLNLNPHPVQFFLVQWMIYALMNIVPTPGAIGGAELTFNYLFKNLLPTDLLAISGSAWRFVSTYLQLMVAAILIVVLERPFRVRFSRKKSFPITPVPKSQASLENGTLIPVEAIHGEKPPNRSF